jgi:hypothetical protein
MTEATSITVRVPLTIRHRPGRKTVVTPAQDGVPAMATRAASALVKALAGAFRYQRLLDEWRYASISEMAAAEKIERGYLGTVLRLTLLAPDVVEDDPGRTVAGGARSAEAADAAPAGLRRAAYRSRRKCRLRAPARPYASRPAPSMPSSGVRAS